jgi:hypothetical protein
MTQMFWLISLIPIIHFTLVYFLAMRNRILHKLKKNYAIMYLDWLFIFVNLSLVMNESATMNTFFLFLLLCIIPLFHLKRGWRDSKQKRKETTLFFNTNGSLNSVGIAHSAFMLLQGALSLQFFFSHALNNSYFIGLLSYFLAYCLIIKYVRKLRFVKKIEMPFVIFGLVLVILRLIGAMYELAII